MDSIPNGWPPPYCIPSCGSDQATNVWVNGGLSNVWVDNPTTNVVVTGGLSNVWVDNPVVTRFDYTPQLDAFGRLRVSQPYTLFDAQQRYGLDETFVSNVANGGSVTFVASQSSANLQVTNTIVSFAARETQFVFTYQPGKSLLFLATFVMTEASTGFRQRVGYFGRENGYYFEIADQAYMVERSNSTGTVTTVAIPQSQWNIDTLMGTGPSGLTLDKSTSQILWIDIEWLGVGNVRTGFVINGQFIPVHIFQHANYSRFAYITTAVLPVRYEIETVSAGAPASSNLIQICSTVISEGGYDPPYRLFSNISSFSRLMTAKTWYPVCSMRLAPGQLDAVVHIRQIDIVMTSPDVLHWAIWSNVTATNLTGEAFVTDPWSKTVQIDNSATAIDISSSRRIANGIVSSTNQATSPQALDLNKYFSQIGRNSFTQTSDILTLAVFSVNGVSGSPATLQSAVSWNELL